MDRMAGQKDSDGHPVTPSQHSSLQSQPIEGSEDASLQTDEQPEFTFADTAINTSPSENQAADTSTATRQPSRSTRQPAAIQEELDLPGAG